MTPAIEFRRAYLLERLAEEDPLTLKAIEALPADKLEWKPTEEKSMTAAALAAHCVGAAEFFLGMATGQPPPASEPPVPTTKEKLLAGARAMQETFRARVAEMTHAELAAGLEFDGQQFTCVQILCWHPWHMVHHRGQLQIYLRLMGASVPAIYGPSADQAWDGG